jgi:hypothetical protein
MSHEGLTYTLVFYFFIFWHILQTQFQEETNTQPPWENHQVEITKYFLKSHILTPRISVTKR